MDGAEERKNVQLFTALDVFIEGGGDGVFLGAVAAQLLGLGNQTVVDGEIGRQGSPQDHFTRKRDFSLLRPTLSQQQKRKKKSACSARNDEGRARALLLIQGLYSPL